ncbi:hypothetical protein SAMN05444397_10394 [Flavobacterium aquidurense]|nr:hypothetical protein SAMN05444397_10394 [Flavobacterium aquidurense]
MKIQFSRDFKRLRYCVVWIFFVSGLLRLFEQSSRVRFQVSLLREFHKVCHSEERGIPVRSSTKIGELLSLEWIDPKASGHPCNIFCSSGTAPKKLKDDFTSKVCYSDGGGISARNSTKIGY